MFGLANRSTIDATMMSDYQTALHYWSHQNSEDPELLGVAALGGCGATEVRYRHYEEVRHFKRMVSLPETAVLLELGCGSGRWVTALGAGVANYEAVDFSEQMLDVARCRAKAIGLHNVHFVQTSAQDYVPERTFDVIYLSGVSQYLHDEDLAQLLRRLVPHLAPEGMIVDRSTTHRRNRNISEQKDYFSIYRTGSDLIRVFTDAGLVNSYRADSYTFLNFSRPIQRVLSTRLIGRFMTATAPASFNVLRTLARLRNALFAPSGELIDYSHEFFIFRRGKSL